MANILAFQLSGCRFNCDFAPMSRPGRRRQKFRRRNARPFWLNGFQPRQGSAP
jgi:hypothetical protein